MQNFGACGAFSTDMRPVALALLMLLSAAAPAAGAPCRATTAGPPVTIEAVVDFGEAVERSAVYVCRRRTGRRVLVRRGRIVRRGGAAGRGRYFADAARSAGRLAFVEVRAGGRRPDAVVVSVLSPRTLRVVRRVTFLRGRGLRYDNAEVAIADDGTIAVGLLLEGPILIARPGERPVQQPGRFVGNLAVEDGVTIRWSPDYAAELVFRDLSTPPLRDGCPARSAFREVARSERLTLTASSTSAVRVCDRMTGGDPVVDSADDNSESTFPAVRAIGASGPVALVARETSAKGQGCLETRVRVSDAAAARVTREVSAQQCRLVPAAPVPIVLAPAGAPAWISAQPRDSFEAATDRVVAVDGDKLVVLDTGPPGSLIDLRATADGVAWRAAGAEKSARLR